MGVKNENTIGHPRFASRAAIGYYIDFLGYPFCRGRILNEIEEDRSQYNDSLPVFWATGAALMIRADVYHKADGLDESFFAHMEEIDMCWRIKNMGYSIKVFPFSEVLHLGGATLDQLHPRKTFLNFRNNLLMLLKNISGKQLMPILIMRMVLDGFAAFHFLIKGEFGFFKAVLYAHISFYQLLPNAWSKRKIQKPLRVKTNHKEVYSRSIIWDFYFKKHKKFSQLRQFHL